MFSVLQHVTQGNIYKSIVMDRSIDGEDLTEVIRSQTLFSLLQTIKKRLQDLMTLSPLKMLSTSILARKTIGLNELKSLQNFYGIKKMIDGKTFSLIIDNDKLS